MALQPLRGWDEVPDNEPKGWLNVEPSTDEDIVINEEAPDLTTPLEEVVDEEPVTEPVTVTDTLEPTPSISDTIAEVFSEPEKIVCVAEPVTLDTIQEAEETGEVNEVANKEETILDLTFDVMKLYNLTYDLTRAFELACSADAIRVTRHDLENAVKLLKHRLQSVDSNEVLTNNAIPLEMSPDWIIDILNLKFLYGKCVDSILTYAQTGDTGLLKSAIRSLEYMLGMMYADEDTRLTNDLVSDPSIRNQS